MKNTSRRFGRAIDRRSLSVSDAIGNEWRDRYTGLGEMEKQHPNLVGGRLDSIG